MDNNCNAGNKIDMNYKRHIVCLDGLAGCYFQNNIQHVSRHQQTVCLFIKLLLSLTLVISLILTL